MQPAGVAATAAGVAPYHSTHITPIDFLSVNVASRDGDAPNYYLAAAGHAQLLALAELLSTTEHVYVFIHHTQLTARHRRRFTCTQHPRRPSTSIVDAVPPARMSASYMS